MKRFWGTILFLLCAIGVYFAFTTVRWQHQAITAFVPTPALVLSSTLGIHRGKNTDYTPDITYSYTFNQTPYTSRRVLAFDENGSSTWARSILSRYAAGAHVTAYVNPINPAESILWRIHSGTPYLLLTLALLGAAVGLGLLTGFIGAGRTTMLAIPIEGRHLLLPVTQLRQQRRGAALVLVTFTLITLPVWAHFQMAAEEHTIATTLLTAGVAIIALLLAANVWRSWNIARRVSDPRLIVAPAPMQLGQPLELHLEFDAHQPLRARAMAAKILCTEHYYDKNRGRNAYGTRTFVERTVYLAGPQDTPAGQIISGDGQTTFDASHPATWAGGKKTYPYYTWEIRIKLDLINLPDYNGVFPLTVEK